MTNEADERRRAESAATLGRLRGEGEVLGTSALARAARGMAHHFAARDADRDGEHDPVEKWGRRIGRALSLIGCIVLAAYLFVTYVR